MRRCKSCKRRALFECKCELWLCQKHLESHDCTFDYRKDHASKLEKVLEKIVSDRGYKQI